MVGYVYRMTAAYVNQLLDLIIATITADSIPLDTLNPNTLLTSLSTDDRPECIHAILKFFSTTPYPPYSIPPTSLQRWYAIRTIQSHPTAQPTPSFLQSWQLSLPSILPPTQDLSLLRGEVFHPTPKTIQYLPQGELAVVPEHRFAQLFGVKEKWALEEILPFLEGCVEGGTGWEKRAEKECQKWARVRGGQVMKR
jgi:Sister chromatid cohesion protein Dcc1